MADFDVSICIATDRQPWRLARLLDSIARLKQPDDLRAEVIVVDNDPASDPGAAVAAGSQVGPFPLRWLREPRRNAAIARNRALEVARGRWIAFVADGAELDERWLAAYWDCASEGESDGYFGPVLPHFELRASEWLDLSFYTAQRWRTGTPVRRGETCIDNAFVRRAVLRDQHFDVMCARSGGEGIALFGRMLARGARFAWCDEAIAHAAVPTARQRPGWLTARAFWTGWVQARVERELGRVRSRSAAATTAIAAASLLWTVCAVALLGGRARALRVALSAADQSGRAWGQLGPRPHRT
jgi:glycosyl transferase family 2